MTSIWKKLIKEVRPLILNLFSYLVSISKEVYNISVESDGDDRISVYSCFFLKYLLQHKKTN